MSDLLRACLKDGLTEVKVLEHKYGQNILGHREKSEVKVAARSHRGFVVVTFSWEIGIFGFGRPDSVPNIFSEPITEMQYKKLTKGKRRIDTPKAIRDLQKEKKRNKGGRHGRRGSTR